VEPEDRPDDEDVPEVRGDEDRAASLRERGVEMFAADDWPAARIPKPP
jgi:hypothetical protein